MEKNIWRYYHFIYLHHKWQSYDVWFLRYGAQQTEFFVILERFLLFYPCMDPENLNFEGKKKKPWRYYHFTQVHHIIMIIYYPVPEIWCVTDIIIFHFGLLFALLQPKKLKFQKNEKKNSWTYHHFTHMYQKLWLDDVLFLRYGVRRTDRQTDGRTDGKSDIYRWVSYLKTNFKSSPSYYHC